MSSDSQISSAEAARRKPKRLATSAALSPPSVATPEEAASDPRVRRLAGVPKGSNELASRCLNRREQDAAGKRTGPDEPYSGATSWPTCGRGVSRGAVGVWNTRDECLRDGDHLRVVRPSAATAGDAVAGKKALDTTADGLDDPRR
jgi:hypothetical protein